ncbi:MAG: non-canonical purine NTP diphosphatase [Flavobacteriaceae bacterium]|nr:non-canonical purine NTP diphosphatase [Flavobacteriaceae bacterium]
MELVFATHNQNKLAEVQRLLPASIRLLSLTDIGCFEDIPETAHTLEGNAQLKADFITQQYGYNCFADDTGLEVEALGGAPGVYSARYAGPGNNSKANIQKLLHALEDKESRKAQFRTVIVLNRYGNRHVFQGICRGSILYQPRGQMGFGYDPVFQPQGTNLSFAEMSMDAKGKISHRGKAMAKLTTFLKLE